MCSLASCEDRSFDLVISSNENFLAEAPHKFKCSNCTTLHIETEQEPCCGTARVYLGIRFLGVLASRT